MAETIEVDLLRRHSFWLSRLTLGLLIATGLVILAGGVLAPLIIGEVTRAVLLDVALRWSPSIFYLYSLWAIQRGFSEFAAGGTFGTAMADGCFRAGIALAAGATLSAVAVPNLARLLIGNGWLPAETSMLHGLLVFDVAYLAVGVVGLALTLLGRLLRRAAAMQAEAAALRQELDEFF